MKIIQAANQIIADVWGKGKTKPGVYRRMTYTIPVSVEEGTLLHNAVTGELVFLDHTEAERLSTPLCDYAPWMDELIEKHFLVRAETDDKKTIDTLRTAFSLANRTKQITGYTILPTTHCNARCFYCYEAGCKHEIMTDETADKLVEYMLAHRGDRDLYIRWFGGEPLVGIRQIDRISAALREREIPFKASMVSNGYLFTKETVRRAKEEWNLKKIQITLDGTETVYNKTKAYLNPCESPYERVLGNIALLLEREISVTIRLNLGLHNADDLFALVDALAVRFPEKPRPTVYVHLLFEGCGFTPTHFEGSDLQRLNARKEALDEHIRSLALAVSQKKLPMIASNHCMADGDGTLVVFPSGRLGKCEHYTDRHFVGSLAGGITDMQEQKLLRERVVLSTCGQCPLYPSCIKLKLCEPSNACTDALAQLQLRETARKIRFIYEEFLRGDKEATGDAEPPVC